MSYPIIIAVSVAFVLTLSLGSCKQYEVPECSDPRVESTLEDLLTRGFPPNEITENWPVVASTIHSGFGGDIGINSILTTHVAVDIAGMRSAFRFSFKDARQRTNGPAEHVRECTIDVDFSTAQPLSDFVHVSRQGVYYESADLKGIADAMRANAADLTKLGPLRKSLTDGQVAAIVDRWSGAALLSIKAKYGQDYVIQRLDKGGWVVRLEN